MALFVLLPEEIHFPGVFFTLALVDGISLGLEWQQISLDLRDASEYFIRSQRYRRLPGFDSSSDFCSFILFSKFLGTILIAPSIIAITATLMSQSFKFSYKVHVFVSLFAFFDFHYEIRWLQNLQVLFSLLINTWSGVLDRIRWCIYFQNPAEFYGSHFLGQIPLWTYEVHTISFQTFSYRHFYW